MTAALQDMRFAVLEEGTYTILAGTNVRNATEIGSFAYRTVALEELSQQLAPRRHLERMTPKTNEDGTLVPIIQAAPVYLQHYSEDTCPQCADYTGDKGYKLDDVKRGIVSMDEFLLQLSDLDLCHIVKGEGMSSPKVTPGTAAAFGGLTPNLLTGIPAAAAQMVRPAFAWTAVLTHLVFLAEPCLPARSTQA